MQTTHKISGSSAAGYAAYVTSSSDRGDYYTASGEGEPTLLAPEPLARLARSARPARPLTRGQVERHELRALMHGVSPSDGRELRRAGGDGSRVAGIDMTFSAPKSVSALWAVSSPYERAQIEAAHARAVAGAIARTEREVALVRTRSEGKLHWEKASSLLAAEFVHTSSRLTRDQESAWRPRPAASLTRGRARRRAIQRSLRRSRIARVVSRRAAPTAPGIAPSSPMASASSAFRSRVATGRDGRYFEIAGVSAKLSERWSMRGRPTSSAPRARFALAMGATRARASSARSRSPRAARRRQRKAWTSTRVEGGRSRSTASRVSERSTCSQPRARALLDATASAGRSSAS